MIFKLNCERCGTLFSKGEIYNYRGKKLCEDCYILSNLFGLEAPHAFLPDVMQQSHRISASVGLSYQLKGKLIEQEQDLEGNYRLPNWKKEKFRLQIGKYLSSFSKIDPLKIAKSKK